MIRTLAVVALIAGSAHAETVVELPKTTTRLVLDDAWTRVPGNDITAGFRHAGGNVLAVTRADVPNRDAWIKDKRKAYADRVERGIKASIPGYKRRAKKLALANGVPALDVEARRGDGATVVVRVLLFRTYALSLAIEVPRGGDVAMARAIVKTFAPPKD